MASRGLCGDECQREAVSLPAAAFVSFIASSIALAKPFANSVGANVSSTLAITGINFSVTSAIIVGVWMLSGIIGSSERHGNLFNCAMSSLGLPAILMAGLSIGSL